MYSYLLLSGILNDIFISSGLADDTQPEILKRRIIPFMIQNPFRYSSKVLIWHPIVPNFSIADSKRATIRQQQTGQDQWYHNWALKQTSTSQKVNNSKHLILRHIIELENHTVFQ